MAVKGGEQWRKIKTVVPKCSPDPLLGESSSSVREVLTSHDTQVVTLLEKTFAFHFNIAEERNDRKSGRQNL